MHTNKPSLVVRESFLTAACRDKRIVHIGCCDSPFTTCKLRDGTLLHRSLSNVAANCTGYDIDSASLQALREAGFSDVWEMDVEHLSSPPNSDIQAVVMGEVIEHLNNVGAALRNILRAYPLAQLLITVPNAFYLHRFLKYLFLGKEEVHPDHTAYYSETTIKETLRRAGYRVEQIAFSRSPARSFLGRLTKLLLMPLYHLNPRLGQSVIIRATPANH